MSRSDVNCRRPAFTDVSSLPLDLFIRNGGATGVDGSGDLVVVTGGSECRRHERVAFLCQANLNDADNVCRSLLKIKINKIILLFFKNKLYF